jgi:hypothetical protein
MLIKNSIDPAPVKAIARYRSLPPKALEVLSISHFSALKSVTS